MEDALVMAQVVEDVLQRESKTEQAESDSIRAAFIGYETVRRARFERVLDSSYEAMSLWSDFWRPDLKELDLERFRHDAYEHMHWIWNGNLEDQCQRARQIARETLKGTNSNNNTT